MEKIKLFCIPYAGGTGTVYMKWKKLLPDFLELYPIELAGRGKRFGEPFYKSVSEAVEDIYAQVKEALQAGPYIFYGHSMGSLLLFELMHKIKAEKGPGPLHIFVSGRFPPHLPKSSRQLYTLSNEDFIREIYKIGGTPSGLFDDKEMVKIFLPILKSDYKITEEYIYCNHRGKLNAGITFFFSTGDKGLTRVQVEEWKIHTEKSFRIVDFEGGHFFIHEHSQAIIRDMEHTLSGYIHRSMEVQA